VSASLTPAPGGGVPRSRQRLLLERAGYTAVAVGSSVIVTAFISLAINGEVRGDYLATGFLCSLAVSVPMIARFQRLRRELTEALQREQELRVRQEKLRTLRLAMATVQHHVDSLAGRLLEVELEYNGTGSLSDETLDALNHAVHLASSELQALADMEDPF
jgi:hypothetical protein